MNDFLDNWHIRCSIRQAIVLLKADVRIKQRLKHAMQRVDTASSENSGQRLDMYTVYKARMKTGLYGLDKTHD